MADPFLSRPAPPRTQPNRSRQRTTSASANVSLPQSSSTRSVVREDESYKPRSSLDGFASTEGMLSHLQSLLVNKTNEIQLAGRLGETLLSQQAELENRIRDLQVAAGGLDSAAGDRRTRATGGLSTIESMQLTDDVREKLESLEAEMAQWERSNEEMYRNAGITKPSRDAQAEPPAAASRRERNNAQTGSKDIALATEIGQSLLMEVRRLQGLLNEQYEINNSERDAREQLERRYEAAQAAQKMAEEHVERYKEENWNLELSAQELRTSHAEAVETTQRAEAERARLTKALATARENYDATRAEADRHIVSIEALRNKHETSMAEARKTAATLQREKSDLQQTLDSAQTQLNARNVRRSVSVGLDSPNTSLQVPRTGETADVAMDEDVIEEDPFSGKAADLGRPRGSILPATGSPAPSLHAADSPMAAVNDVSQLRQALAHRQKTIETLRAALQREKEARLRGKRTVEDEDEESADGSPVQARKVSKRGTSRRGMSALRGRSGRRTVGSRAEREDIEEYEDEEESIRDAHESLDTAFDRRQKSSYASLDPAFGGDDSFTASIAGDRAPSIRRTSIGSILSRGNFSSMADLAQVQGTDAEAQVDSLTEKHNAELLRVASEHEAALQGLREEHQAALSTLEQAQSDALDAGSVRHANALEGLRAAHSEAMSRLSGEHSLALQQRDAAMRDLQDSHTLTLAQVRDAHAQVALSTATRHAEELDSLRRAHVEELARLRAQLSDLALQRDEALGKLREQHDEAIAALKATHTTALDEVAAQNTTLQDQLRTKHILAMEEMQQTMRGAHEIETNSLKRSHAQAFEDASYRHETELADLKRAHSTDLSRTRTDLAAKHDAALALLKAEHSQAMDAQSDRSGVELEELRQAHSAALSMVYAEHATALQARDTQSHQDLQDLHRRLSNEQEAALAAAAANEEQAAAISRLKEVHARAMDSASTRHDEEMKTTRNDHQSEVSRLRDEHSAALRQTSQKSHLDLQTLREKLVVDHQGALASAESKHAAASKALATHHAEQIETLQKEQQKAADHVKRSHDATLQQALSDLECQHAVSVTALRGEHEEKIDALRQRHEASLQSLRNEHRNALAAMQAESGRSLADTRRTHEEMLQTAEAKYRSALADLEQRQQTASAQTRAQHQMELSAQTAAHERALAAAVAEAEAAALATAQRKGKRYSMATEDGYDTARDEETDGETDFEDATESLPPAMPIALSSRTIAAPAQTAIETLDVGVQTDELLATEAWFRRNSRDTFGGRASGLGISSGTPIIVQTIGEERALSPEDVERADSVLSLASSTNTMLPPPVPVIKSSDKSKAPQFNMPPPPTVPPPRTLSPRKSTASNKSSTKPPPRPISPPPADLLQRATTPGLLMPTAARQQSVGGTFVSPMKKPRTAASVPTLGAQVRSPRAAQSVGEFGAFPGQTHPLRTSDASSASGASRRSRAQSVASSRTSEGDHSTYGGAPPLPGAHWGTDGVGTDPVIIRAITQTMIGEFMYKYTRKTFGSGLSDTRHKRFFWVHPYTKTLYWSPTDPAGQYSAHEQTSKSVFIEGVEEVYDPNPVPPGLCQYSLVIKTPGRDIKLTALTQERHDLWLQAITFLLARPEGEAPGSPTSQMSTFSASAARASTGMYRAHSANSPTRRRQMYNMPSASDSRLASKSPASQSMSRYGSRSRSRMSAASAMHLKRSDTPAAQYLLESVNYGSPRSIRSFSGDDTMFNDDSFEQGHTAEISFGPAQVEDEDDDDFEGLENVRVCCGEHDVGRLSRQSRHSHGPHDHVHDGDRPISPALSISTRRSGRKSITSLWSSRIAEPVPPIPSTHL